MTWLRDLTRRLGAIALLLFVVAVLGFGARFDGYSQQRDPVALLGAHGVPHALAFDLLGFVLPGLLCAWVAVRMRNRQALDAPYGGRLGTQLLLLSALAFAAQGVAALDPRDLDAPASRLHASIWMLWWIAFAAGTILQAVAWRRACPRRALAALGIAIVLPLLALAGHRWMPAAIAQRLAFALWFGWIMNAAGGPAQSRQRASN